MIPYAVKTTSMADARVLLGAASPFALGRSPIYRTHWPKSCSVAPLLTWSTNRRRGD
jgi:hypothetical protein